jgi:hypothetical protein
MNLLKTRTQSLESNEKGLKDFIDSFISYRQRFISTFKCDILKSADQRDIKIIASGNVFAHHGNAKRDAELCGVAFDKNYGNYITY